MACWLERGQVGARQAAFAARSALAGLDATERGRLARWLAWLAVAAQSRGKESPLGRVRRLDATMHAPPPIKIAVGNPVERQLGLLKAAFERDGV